MLFDFTGNGLTFFEFFFYPNQISAAGGSGHMQEFEGVSVSREYGGVIRGSPGSQSERDLSWRF